MSKSISNTHLAVVVTTKSSSKDENNKSKKKRPALTIKIENSSFNDNDAEEDAEFVSELEKSPNIYISGMYSYLYLCLTLFFMEWDVFVCFDFILNFQQSIPIYLLLKADKNLVILTPVQFVNAHKINAKNGVFFLSFKLSQCQIRFNKGN